MPRTQLTKMKITETALSIAEQQGYQAVTMANIARSLTIKPPSLYNHFKNLDEIKLAMAQTAQHKLYEALKGTEQVNRPLLTFAKKYVDFGISHPGLYASSLPGGTGKAGDAILLLVKDAFEAFDLAEEEKIHAIRGFRSMLHGFIDLEGNGGFKLDIDLEASLTEMVGIFERGLSA